MGIDINEPLRVCLEKFSGAKIGAPKREDSLIKQFEALARKMIYGGYIRVRNEYAIFLSKVEFYYHEEEAVPGERIIDSIVYHRDGRFLHREVPYFPIMTLHSHWSGFDITFEKETSHYRASALIRKYVVIDLKSEQKEYIKLDTSPNSIKPLDNSGKIKTVGKIVASTEPQEDDRSTYLQYYLNGFSIDGYDSCIQWRELDNPKYLNVIREKRKNAPEHDWGYVYQDKKDYFAVIQQVKDSL